MNMDVSIIIVNYNTKQLLFNCLESVYRYTKNISFEVIVSDNGSTDGSIEMVHKTFPQVIVLENKANLGFGKANNKGLDIAEGKFVFYLNSDTIFLNNAVKFFVDYWNENCDKKIGGLGSNLLNKNGENIHSYDDTFPSLHHYFYDTIHLIYGLYKIAFLHLLLNKPVPLFPYDDKQKRRVGKVAQIIGADLFLKNDCFARFDENYFMYNEETDLQYRLTKQNKSFFVVDGPKIIHLDGGSTKKNFSNDVIHKYATFSKVNSTLSRIYFFSKYGTPVYKIFFMKLLTFMLWCNPFLFTKNKKYFWRLLTI
jgi:GT2 family glycosyltransferase